MTGRILTGVFGVCLLLLCVVTTAASAQEGRIWAEGDRYVRLHLGLMYYGVDDPPGQSSNTVNDFTIGGAIGFFLRERWSVEIEGGFANGASYTVVVDDFEGFGRVTFKTPSSDILHLNGNGHFFLTTWPLSPYLTGGVGITRFGKINSEGITVRVGNEDRSFQTPEVPSSTKFSGNVGAGFDLDAFRIEYRQFFHVNPDEIDTMGRFTAGFNVPWG